MGRKPALVKYAGLLDASSDIPEWAKRYARWLVKQGVWNERLTGQGRKKKSRVEHLDEIEKYSGVRFPWKVVISLRQLPRFREYGDRWSGSREIRIQDLQGEVKEMSLERVRDKLEADLKVTELARLVVAGEALQPRRTETAEKAPMIQINISEAVAKRLAEPEQRIEPLEVEVLPAESDG